MADQVVSQLQVLLSTFYGGSCDKARRKEIGEAVCPGAISAPSPVTRLVLHTERKLFDFRHHKAAWHICAHILRSQCVAAIAMPHLSSALAAQFLPCRVQLLLAGMTRTCASSLPKPLKSCFEIGGE